MRKGWVLILVSVVLGVAAFAAAYFAVTLKEREVTAGWDLVEVLTFSESLRPGSIVTASSLERSLMPSKFFHPSVIMTPRFEGEALNKEVLVHVEKGQPIHWYQLAGLKELDLLSSQVRTGRRAVTINVDEASAVAHWIRPNDTVDVIATFRDPTKRELSTVTLLHHVSILATGRTSAIAGSAEDADDRYHTVTLQVMPEEAEILILAQELGGLHLTLRNREDQGVSKERSRTTIETLITGTKLQELERQRRDTVRIIRGLKETRR